VCDVHLRGVIEREGQLSCDVDGVLGRRWSELADGKIERLGGHVLGREIRRDASDARCDRRRYRAKRQLRRNEMLERREQLMHALGRHVQLEDLDGDETLPLRIVATKHGSEGASTNLMKNAKRSERIGRRAARGFRLQLWTPREGRFSNRNIIAIK
jgi:hypothetical protein